MIASMAAPAAAGWKKVETDSLGDTFYFDSQRVTRIGDGVQYWYRVVLAYPNYQGMKSFNVKVQGDCYFRKIRALEERYFDGRGKSLGQLVMNESPRYVTSGTYGEILLMSACNL